MKKKLVFSAMLVCLLALGFALVGCSSDDGGGIEIPGEYQGSTWINANGDKIEFTKYTVKATPRGGDMTELTPSNVRPSGSKPDQTVIVFGSDNDGTDIYVYTNGSGVAEVNLYDIGIMSEGWTRQSGNGPANNLANTTWQGVYNGSDGTIITATLSFSGTNAYTLGLNINIVDIGMVLTPSQTGTYTLTDDQITLTPTPGLTDGIFTETGTLNGNTISMLIGINNYGKHEDGVFTLTKM
jgi:hypothetical protein